VAAEAGGEARRLDVTDAAACDALARAVDAARDGIDIWCSNAGISTMAAFTEITEQEYDANLDVNLKGVFLCGQAAARVMIARGRGGSIVNTASMVALQGSATPQIAYDATKGAVVTMSRDVAVTYGRRGIRCNALCPGPVETPLFRNIFGQDPVGLARRLVHIPMGRVGTPEEVAHAVVYLASDESSWTSGTAFLVDGAITNAYTTADD
jgi:NAD(P)-dependent dehydrogenase (short-subunit alcohol dehydrogenase family)